MMFQNAAMNAKPPAAALATVEIKAFVPARDFERSRRFYLDLGFEVPWSDGELAYVRHGDTAFLLQAFDDPGFAASFQMHLLVADADAWHAHVLASGVTARYGVQVGEPQDRPWRMRDFTLFDPGGVLWRIAHNLPREAAG